MVMMSSNEYLGLSRHPKDVPLYLALARLERQAGRPGEAAAALRLGLEALPDSLELLAALTDALVRDGPIDEASEAVARLRRQGSVAPLADYMEGSLLVRRKQWDRALPLLERARPQLPAPWGLRQSRLPASAARTSQ